MAEITAQMVKDLREKSGAGMMDCKAALAETKGDVEAAIDWLRKKGLSKAAKKSGRVAAEGLVAVAVEGTKGVVVEVNSETDFVARNEQFQQLVKTIATVALKTTGDVEALKKAAYPSGGTVEDAIASTIATIGENMTLRRVDRVAVSSGVVASYVHNAILDGLGKIGVLVGLQSTGKTDELQALGKQIAMHVAASSPLSLDAASLPADIVAREKAVIADKAKQSGKPDNVIEKIVDSGLKTFYKEVTLLEQGFVLDPSKSITQVLKEAEGKAGAPVTLPSYIRFGLGEGIEKQETDFAAEVEAARKVG